MDDIARYNKERWEDLAQNNVEWSRPMLNLTPDTARQDVDPHNLLGELRAAGRKRDGPRFLRDTVGAGSGRDGALQVRGAAGTGRYARSVALCGSIVRRGMARLFDQLRARFRARIRRGKAGAASGRH